MAALPTGAVVVLLFLPGAAGTRCGQDFQEMIFWEMVLGDDFLGDDFLSVPVRVPPLPPLPAFCSWCIQCTEMM